VNSNGNAGDKRKSEIVSESEWESSEDQEVIKKHESSTRARIVTNVAEIPPAKKREVKYVEKKEVEQEIVAKKTAAGP
jgi:hypothetical protein